MPRRGEKAIVVSSVQNGKATPLRPRRRAWVALGIWAAGVLFSIVVLLVWPYGMSAYDDGHRRELSCDVSGAERYAGSTVSRTGLGAPFSYVKVDTTDCGILILQGVPKANQQAVASKISGAGKVRFEVGESSYWFRGALQVINRYPTAFGYRIEN
jgi:hypothetical protein